MGEGKEEEEEAGERKILLKCPDNLNSFISPTKGKPGNCTVEVLELLGF